MTCCKPFSRHTAVVVARRYQQKPHFVSIVWANCQQPISIWATPIHWWSYSNNSLPFPMPPLYSFFEQQGLVQQLIHQLKYMNGEQLGSLFGSLLGQKLVGSSFLSCDLVVPIPLHRRRQRQRGYNQVSQFGQQLTKQLQVGYVPQNLIRHKSTKTLVRLNTQQRAGQIKDAFSLIDTSVFTGKHLLLVDDVVTTGTTLSEAANCLLQIEDAQVSVATIAFAKSPLP